MHSCVYIGPVPYLVFTFAEELLFAQVINSKQFSNSHQDSSLERCYGQWNILYWGLSIIKQSDPLGPSYNKSHNSLNVIKYTPSVPLHH